MRKTILATALALAIASPAIAAPVSDRKTVSDFLALKNLVLDSQIKCVTLIGLTQKLDKLGCIEQVNKGAKDFNRLVDMKCGSGMEWTGSTACEKLTKLPTLRLKVEVVEPR
jgi:hypothetical protein